MPSSRFGRKVCFRREVIKSIKCSATTAEKEDGYPDIVDHKFNFGADTDELIKNLEGLLQFVKENQDTHVFWIESFER